MNPFWRELSLSDEENLLLHAVFEAHGESAMRENCSTQALLVAAAGSRSLPQSLIAALSTLGERHAPLKETYDFLLQPNPEEVIGQILTVGGKVPGWGNSFHKGPDPVWEPVRNTLQQCFPEMHSRLLEVTAILHSFGKPLQPNPSAFTAATAIILGMPKEMSYYLLIAGRLLNWHRLFYETLK